MKGNAGDDSSELPRGQRSTRDGGPMWGRLFRLDAHKSQSLQSQLREQLVEAILERRFAIDRPMPSSRELARELGIARNTVVLAYQHLVDDQYLLSFERRGFFVNPDMLAGRVDAPVSSDRSAPGTALDDDPPELHGPNTCIDLLDAPNIRWPKDWQRFEYPFIYGQVDNTLFPVNDWREACRLSLRVDAISRWTQDQTDHDDDLLIEQIQRRVLPRRGVWAERDEILITAGAQNALFLVAQLLLDRRCRFGIEDPCYVDARNIFELFAGERVSFPVSTDGVDTDDRLQGCRLLYVTPSHQCPTTTTMPLAKRQNLLQQASRFGVTLVEDDYESELNFVGQPTPALKSLDTEHRVIYVGSLSKTLAPGLRMGFLVASKRFIRQARALRRLMYRHPPTNNQRTVAHFLALGHHDASLHRLMQAFRRRWTVLDRALSEHESLASVAPGFGGTSFWVRLPETVRARRLERIAADNGVIINAGDDYFADAEHPINYCRLGFSSIDEHRIEGGIERLATLLDQHRDHLTETD